MSEQVRKIVPPKLYQNHFSTMVFKTSFTNCVHRALTLRKWKEHESGTWNLQWFQKQRVNDVFEEGVSANQRVNHFRLYTQLCRKDMLMKNVRKHKRELAKEKKLVEAEWDFLPATFFLPSEYIMFVQQFKKKNGLWIMKPTGRCQGSGIFLVDRISQVAPYKTKAIQPQNNQPPKKKKFEKHQPQQQQQIQDQNSESEDNQGEKETTLEGNKNEQEEGNVNETFIIQKYIDKPLLFGRKKFDMRIYVLCTDYRNLTVWLYRNGFARFTHEPYNIDDIENLTGHLTNVQIQKHADNYDVVRGGKWFLNQFKHFLMSRYPRESVEKCFWNIQDIILKSLLAVQKKILPSKSSFELYGYDFMLDDCLKPWLIEVNGGPSMSANTDFDCELKCGIVDDVLSILDLQGILTGNQMTVGGFDLIMKKDIPIKYHSSCSQLSSLGSKNQRKKIMKRLAIQFMTRKLAEKNQNIEQQQQKERKRKRREEMKENKKQKLLPNFYYNRKQEQVNQNAKYELKSELAFLDRDEEYEKKGYQEFVPLRG